MKDESIESMERRLNRQKGNGLASRAYIDDDDEFEFVFVEICMLNSEHVDSSDEGDEGPENLINEHLAKYGLAVHSWTTGSAVLVLERISSKRRRVAEEAKRLKRSEVEQRGRRRSRRGGRVYFGLRGNGVERGHTAPRFGRQLVGHLGK